MKTLSHTIRDRTFVCNLVVTDVDEGIVEDGCFDMLCSVYPDSVITCLDIDCDDTERYNGQEVYHLTFLVECR